MKIKHKIWFTQMKKPWEVLPTIGIVIVENDQGEERAYIGTGIGADELTDADDIVVYGAKFPLEVAKQVMEI